MSVCVFGGQLRGISSTGQTGCPSLMRFNKNLHVNVCWGVGDVKEETLLTRGESFY